MTFRRFSVCLGLLLPLGFAGGVCAEDWPYWRGPERTDISSESSGYKKGEAWPGAELWTANLPRGASAPVVVQGKLYSIGYEGKGDRGQEVLSCLDA
ncbi:MAG: hypothetical protein AAF517_07490, partial [Planctomycetota bacterium]